MGLLSSAKIELEKIRNRNLFRQAAILEQRNNNTITVNNKRLINFSSNDYLGLSSHADILNSISSTANKFGFGSTASPLVCGKTAHHQRLEEMIAFKTGRDRALLFPSGYQANLGMVTVLSLIQGVEFFVDRLCHASIVDGLILSRSRFKRYAHNDIESLDSMLQKSNADVKLVLTESVFSMDGDICPLVEISNVAIRQGAQLVVDDAHGFGVMGEGCQGTLAHFGVSQDVAPLMTGTFGKALGLQGAFVAGDNNVIELLVQRARPYIYSTAMSAPLAVGVLEAISVIDKEPQRKLKLFENIKYFQKELLEHGIKIQNTNSPIQPIIVGSSTNAIKLYERLKAKGIFVVGIRPPTVPEGTARIRISLNSNHQSNELTALIEALVSEYKALETE
jgi:8-amino-7-oxononanoate synthase